LALASALGQVHEEITDFQKELFGDAVTPCNGLRPRVTRHNEDVVFVEKLGNPFRVADGQSKNKVVGLAIQFQAYKHPDESWLDIIPSLQ